MSGPLSFLDLPASPVGKSLPRANAKRRAGLIRGRKIKQWVFYQRDEARIAAAKELLRGEW